MDTLGGAGAEVCIMQSGGDHGLTKDCLKVSEPTLVIRAVVIIDCTVATVSNTATLPQNDGITADVVALAAVHAQ